MKKTLLEQARQFPGRKRKLSPKHDQHQLENLALAWLKDELTNSQVARTLSNGKTDSWNQMYRIAVALKGLYRKGKLKITTY